jgi:hypothetical protein
MQIVNEHAVICSWEEVCDLQAVPKVWLWTNLHDTLFLNSKQIKSPFSVIPSPLSLPNVNSSITNNYFSNKIYKISTIEVKHVKPTIY